MRMTYPVITNKFIKMRSIVFAIIVLALAVCAGFAVKKSGKADLTNYESYPNPGSKECIEYNGCKWAGQFAFLDKKQTKEWDESHNIIAVHHKDAAKYKLKTTKTFKITQGSHHIEAKVYEECSDKDCDGCCTKISKNTGFLIDMEKYSLKRLGGRDGVVQWTCIDC